MQCFRREAILGRTLRHPSLIAIRDAHLHEPPFYHVCDVVPGHTLRHAALLPRPVVLSVIGQIAEALAVMHAAGCIHGDVKPGNIMLAPDGRATLIDLGFARKSGTLPFDDGIPGTPNYLAPELCTREFTDTPAADLFALGVTACELLTGELPYERLDDNLAVMRQHRDETPRPLREIDPAIPREIADLVDAMLNRDLFRRAKARRVTAVLKTSRVAA